eukprot:2089136-Rhodomonas_salina.1
MSPQSDHTGVPGPDLGDAVPSAPCPHSPLLAMQCPVLSYALSATALGMLPLSATRCPVLTSGMLLPGAGSGLPRSPLLLLLWRGLLPPFFLLCWVRDHLARDQAAHDQQR